MTFSEWLSLNEIGTQDSGRGSDEWSMAQQKIAAFLQNVKPQVKATVQQWVEIDPINQDRVVNLAAEINSPEDLTNKVFQLRRDIQKSGGTPPPFQA